MSFMYIFYLSLLILCHNSVLEGTNVKKTLGLEETLANELLSIFNEEGPHLLDPNDMLAPPRSSVSKMKLGENLSPVEDFGPSSDSIDKCDYEKIKEKQCIGQLKHCSSKISEFESELKKKEQQSSLLQSQLLKDKYVDFEGFYSRILRRFWSLLEMEAAEKLLGRDNEAVIRHLTVQVTEADIVAFKELFQEKKVHSQIDSFFYLSFSAETKNDNGNGFQTLAEKFNNFLHHISYSETWLSVLWILMIPLFVWMLVLFILDIHRKLQWRRVLFMILVFAFFISCIFHWKHMIKVRELKRQSYLREKGHAEERLRHAEDNSIWTKISLALFGGQTDHEKYYESMMISPAEEISPMMVVSETLSKFVLLPLSDMGLHLGLFFKSFYQNIPWMWQLPATILFVLLFTISLMTCFGYGIHFPFWLGGIYPSNSEDHSGKVKQLIREGEENMKILNKKLINEAKEMIIHISQAAISQSHGLTNPTYLDPIIYRSATVIERNLEHLITEKFARHTLLLEGKNGERGLSRENRRVTTGSETHPTQCRGRPENNSSVETKDEVDGSIQLRSQRRFPSNSSIVPSPLRRRALHEENQKRTDENIAGSGRSRELCNNCIQLDAVRPVANSCISEDYDDADFLKRVKSVFEEFSLTQDTSAHTHSEEDNFLDTVQNLVSE